MGPQMTVLIIEVSLFQSAHNSRFDCNYYYYYYDNYYTFLLLLCVSYFLLISALHYKMNKLNQNHFINSSKVSFSAHLRSAQYPNQIVQYTDSVHAMLILTFLLHCSNILQILKNIIITI